MGKYTLINISCINKWISEFPFCHWTTNSCYFLCKPSGSCYLKLISFHTTILQLYFFIIIPQEVIQLVLCLSKYLSIVCQLYTQYFTHNFTRLYTCTTLQSSQHVVLNLIECYIQLNWYLTKWIWKFKLNINVVLKLTDNAKDNTGSKIVSR